MSLRVVFLFLAVVIVVQASKDALKAKSKCHYRRGDLCLRYGTTGKKNWQDAEADCVSMGGHLVSAPNKDMQDYIDYIRQWDFWIGGRQQNDGTWTWSDGSSFNYTARAAGRPPWNEKFCMFLEEESGGWARSWAPPEDLFSISKIAAQCVAEPNRPICEKAREFLHIVQNDPVAQARLKRSNGDFPTYATATLIVLIIIGGLLGG